MNDMILGLMITVSIMIVLTIVFEIERNNPHDKK